MAVNGWYAARGSIRARQYGGKELRLSSSSRPVVGRSEKSELGSSSSTKEKSPTERIKSISTYTVHSLHSPTLLHNHKKMPTRLHKHATKNPKRNKRFGKRDLRKKPYMYAPTCQTKQKRFEEKTYFFEALQYCTYILP
jgi:hypothetical protein